MTSRAFRSAAAVAALSLSLAACSSGGGGGATGTTTGGSAAPAPAEKATIKFLAPEYSDKTGPYWKELIAAYQKDNPNVTVELEMIAWTNVSTKLNTLVSAGTPPDIANLDSYVSFAADDLLLPVEEALPKATYDDLIPVMRDNGSYKGKAYGIPFISSARALFYNEELLEKAGVKPPTNWAELKSAAEAVKAKTGQIGYGMPMGAPENFGEFSIWAWNNGGDWRKDDKWTINSKENVEALQAQLDMYKAGVTQTSPWSTNRDDLFKMFGEGKVGILEGAVFLPSVMKGQNSKVKYGITKSPNNAGKPNATLAVEDYLMAFKSTKSKAAVASFLAYFYKADNYKKFLTTEGMLPVTKSAVDAMKTDPVAGPFVGMLENAKFYPTTIPSWPAVQAEAVAKMGLAISGQQTPQQVLDGLQKFAESQK